MFNLKAIAQPCSSALPTVVYPGGYEDPNFGSTGEIDYNMGTDYHEINAGNFGGTVIFDGVYYLKCPLRLTGGKFEFRPNTVFYVKPSGSPLTTASVCSKYGLVDHHNFIEAEDAELIIDGTTFTNDLCTDLWGGIYLIGGSSITMINSSVIENAYIGLALDYDCDHENSNQYYIEDSYFTNNIHGIWDSYKVALPGEKVRNTQFFVDYPDLPYNYPFSVPGTTANGLTGMYFENDWVGTNIPHDYSNALFADNHFVNLAHYGMYGMGANMRIQTSTFRNIGKAAIKMTCDQISLIEMKGNTIEVPYTHHPINNTADPIIGIDAHINTLVTGNRIFGDSPFPPSAGTGTNTIGILADDFVRVLFMEFNELWDLEVALAHYDNTFIEARVLGNTFRNNRKGIHLWTSLGTVGNNSWIRCNTFENSGAAGPMQGIYSEGATFLQTIRGVNPGTAAGNSFLLDPTWDEPVNNSGTNSAFEYYGYDSPTSEDFGPYGGIIFGPTSPGGWMPQPYFGLNTTPCSGMGVGVQRQASAIATSTLGQSYPNPATGREITIPYTLPENYTSAELEIKELVTGRLVGKYSLSIEGQELSLQLNNIASGVYTYSLIIDDTVADTKKLVLIK